MPGLDLAITQLSSVATLVSSSETIPSANKPVAIASFNKTIAYLKKLRQIGSGLPNTTQNIPTRFDIANIANTGLIQNQLFIDSLCQLLRILNPPQITKQEETQE